MNTMKNPIYDVSARKRTVSLTFNSDLHARAKAAGINLSKGAERAVAQVLTQRLAEQAKSEVRQDLDALEAFVEAHGSFAEMVRDHYATVDVDAPV
jgi:post-segregation antitoxin (ccd killing protein)